MRSYCYYKGSCNSPGLKSLKLTLLSGYEFEIVKS